MPLTDAKIRNAKPETKAYKLSDGEGLCLLVTPTGGKLWRLNYRFNGKQKTLALGAYPIMKLQDARLKKNEAKAMLAGGIDPGVEKQKRKDSLKQERRHSGMTLEKAASEWMDRKLAHVTERHRHLVTQLLVGRVYPAIGSTPLSDLESFNIAKLLRKVEEDGHIITAYRILSILKRIFRYSVLMGYCKYDITSGLQETLSPHPSTVHRKAPLSKEMIKRVLEAIDRCNGDISTRYSLKIMPYVFVRVKELRLAEWSEIDFNNALWSIPAEHMKMKRPHIVPMSKQVLALFKELQQFTGEEKFCFPSPVNMGMPICQTGMLNALRHTGISKDEACIHGFRGTASTILYESRKFRTEAIEAQLAHKDKNLVRAAYNHSDYLEERRELMQWYADYLDSVRG